MIIVTGGAGFIGSHLTRALTKQYPHDPIIVVDDLTEGKKFLNLAGTLIADYWDRAYFLSQLQQQPEKYQAVKAIFHQGACTETTAWDGRYMMENNFEYSKILLHHCVNHDIPFIYASSAAIYGTGQQFSEIIENEKPVNVYAYSKWLFDHYTRNLLQQQSVTTPVVGLRYFNVYGPHEQHKQNMASVMFHFNRQVTETGKIKLFSGVDGFANGEQRRDFIYVEDVVAVNLWMFENKKQGIFNVGTGETRSFNDVARAVIAYHGFGEIEYIPFPAQLRGYYQSYTRADLSQLLAAGYPKKFIDLETGVRKYLDHLKTGY